MILRVFIALVMSGLISLPSVAHALPARFAQSVVARGLDRPTAMAFLPDGRLLVTEQGGKLRIIKQGRLLTIPYLSVRTTDAGERGLLGIAIDPQFSHNHFVYVYYTVPGSPAHNRVRRYTQSSGQPDIAQTGSGVTILDLDPLSSATNHNGGAIHFGPDGKLYIGVGENANGDNAELLTNRLGKILRINKDGSIPTDNPLLSQTTGRNGSIWAYGLRNPFTFAFDSTTDQLFINDVGQSAWEEVDLGQAGANYGWPTCEGKCPPTKLAVARKLTVDPIYQYAHNGESAAITGAAFYRAQLYPSIYRGNYFFGDYLQNVIRRREPNGRVTTFNTNAPGVVDIQVGTNGKLYYASVTEGTVFRISYQ